jgi:hypothetical protein
MAHDPYDTHINPPHVVFADDLSVSMADPDLERCQRIYADGGADALRAFIDERARVARLRDEGIPDACEPMTSHDLAQVLLTLPNKLVATHANNHTFESDPSFTGWGVLKVRETDKFIVIGNMSDEPHAR